MLIIGNLHKGKRNARETGKKSFIKPNGYHITNEEETKVEA